jgi:hypothetical protein
MSGPGFVFLFFLFSFFAECPAMRPEKEKLHKPVCPRAVFQRFSRAPESRDSDVGEKMIFRPLSRCTTVGHAPAADRKLKMR